MTNCKNCKFKDTSITIEPCVHCEHNPFCFDHEPKNNFELIEHRQTITELAHDISELVEKKNNDYGNSFDNTIREFGNIVYFIRIQDKINRLKMLMLQDKEIEIKSESIEDTLKDVIGYTLLMLNYIKNNE